MVILLSLTVLFWKARRNYMALPELAKVPDSAEMPDVTVIIPARNEASLIGSCIKSLARAKVLVVNDDSTDKTAEVAAKAGATVIDAPTVHQEAMGKSNALVAGAAGVKTSYLFFTDADTRFQKAFLPSIVQHAKRTESILVTAFLHQDCRSLLSSMLVPYFSGLYFTGVNGKAVNQTLARDVLACGQCMLFERQPYEFFGGHRAVIRSVLDDFEIAGVVKRHRMRMQVMRAEELGSVRYPRALSGLWRHYQRVWWLLITQRSRLTMLVMLTWFLMFCVVPVAVWLYIEHQMWLLVALLVWPVVLLKPWYRSWLGVLLYLPTIYLAGCIAMHSILTAAMGMDVRWKGRRV
ncbi:MAG: glycosyltransferase [Acidobacteria bacterium]|nr:glycosyltransferase [Acidobacteriota bacterium]